MKNKILNFLLVTFAVFALSVVAFAAPKANSDTASTIDIVQIQTNAPLAAVKTVVSPGDFVNVEIVETLKTRADADMPTGIKSVHTVSIGQTENAEIMSPAPITPTSPPIKETIRIETNIFDYPDKRLYEQPFAFGSASFHCRQ